MGGGVEVGFKKHAGALTFNPFAAVEYDGLRQGGYSESDPTWGNRYNTEWVDSLPVSVGVRIEGDFLDGRGLRFRPSMKYAYTKELQTDRNITMSTLPSPGCECSIDGVSAPEEMHTLELGLQSQWRNGLGLNANASYRWANDGHSLTGSVTLDYKF